MDIQQSHPESPIIILAMPRSGSQMLRALLNTHPEVFVAADSAIIPSIFNPGLSTRQIGETLSEEFNETHRTYEHLLASLRNFVHSFCVTSGEPAQLGKTTFQHWGLINYLLPRQLMPVSLPTIFPKARFIHLVRDPRQVIASWLSNWQVASYGMPEIQVGARAVAEMWVDWLKASKTYPAHHIRLEDLIDPATRQRAQHSLLEACKLTSCPSVDAFTHKMPVINAGKKISRDSFTWEEVAEVPGFQEAMEQYGYPL